MFNPLNVNLQNLTCFSVSFIFRFQNKIYLKFTCVQLNGLREESFKGNIFQAAENEFIRTGIYYKELVLRWRLFMYNVVRCAIW